MCACLNIFLYPGTNLKNNPYGVNEWSTYLTYINGNMDGMYTI